MDKNINELFYWNSSEKDELKKDIVDWYNSLTDVEKNYVDILREQARSEEYDSLAGEDI
jgi:cell division FtsZ-interacting protein ZapD